MTDPELTKGTPSAASHQRSLPFEGSGVTRNDAQLLHSLRKALLIADRDGIAEQVLKGSFGDAVTGLGAEKGVLLYVRQQHPIEVEILYAVGLSSEEESVCCGLRSALGISATLIRNAIDDGEARLIENPGGLGLDVNAALRDRPCSVICAPITDSLTAGVVAVLYFQNEASRVFEAKDLEWLTAYAAALGRALTLHASGQRRIQEIAAQWRRAQAADGPEIIGESEATRQLGQTLNILLPSTTRSDAPAILVTGESGTGKELVARHIHHYSPKRSRGPFQAFNCAGLRGDLAESKLFGHARGAFTGAIADTPGLFRTANNGVLLLDEVGELPLEGQALLLRVLETRVVQPVGETKGFAVDVQVILATNRKLEEEVAAKRFREDLYYRVGGLQVELAPLRDPRRLADIHPLLSYYLAKHERALWGSPAKRFVLYSSSPGRVTYASSATSACAW